MNSPDVRELIGEVAARHGIRLEPDDPAFALVTLHRLVFERVLAEAVLEIQTAADRFGDIQSSNAETWQRLTDELVMMSGKVREVIETLERPQPTVLCTSDYPVGTGRATRTAMIGSATTLSPLGGKDMKRLQTEADVWVQQIHLAGERALRMADEFGRRFRWTLLTVSSLCFLAGMVTGAASLWLMVKR